MTAQERNNMLLNDPVSRVIPKLAIPTIISGLYGMNVSGKWMPLSNTPYGFGIICLGTLIICILILLILRKKNML